MSRIAQIRALNHPLKDSLQHYYGGNLIDLIGVSDVKFRHFRLRLLDGTFHKVKQKIRNPEDLQHTLTNYVPLDVYYSTATWLNPHLIASRLDKDILKNIFLSCDLSFDIDVSFKIPTLVEARNQAVNLTDFLHSKGFRIRYTAFSGSKGFHVVCDNPWVTETHDLQPLKRELIAITRRKELVKEAASEKILFDEKVTVDTRRIIRLPGTINSKTGLACTKLTGKELESEIETILKLATREEFHALRIPSREMTAPSANKISGSPGRLGVRPGPADNISYNLYYTNNIPGTQLKIPIMEFDAWLRMDGIKLIIGNTQRQYGLGSVYLFGDDEKYWAASLKALPRRRVEKILSFSGSTNINQSKKYGCTYTRIGRSVSVEGKTVQSEPRFLGILQGDTSGQISRTHLEFFSSLGIEPQRDDYTLCGASLEKLGSFTQSSSELFRRGVKSSYQVLPSQGRREKHAEVS